MPVSIAEFKENLPKYLLLAAMEEILITDRGEVIAKLVSPFQDRVKTAKSLFGILPKTITPEEVEEEKFKNLCGY